MYVDDDDKYFDVDITTPAPAQAQSKNLPVYIAVIKVRVDFNPLLLLINGIIISTLTLCVLSSPFSLLLILFYFFGVCYFDL